MVAFPNAKINIGLNITGKRQDGYHDLETVFYPVAVKDIVEIIVAHPSSPPIELTTSGNVIDSNSEDNLCIKAFHLIKKDFPDIPPLKMHLHKNIPMGAGLGGGSSDAAMVLMMMNKMFSLHIPDPQLLNYALVLGSDCPFFILNRPALAKGRGELLTPIAVDLSAYKIMIIHPGTHIKTASAFANLKDTFSERSVLENNITKEVGYWKGNIHNDFESSVFTTHPEINEIKEKLYRAGAVYCSMSGSGSSVFGLFKKEHTINIQIPSFWFCQTV